MLGGKRCYLCGGKLVNGRCVECGLDNEKNTKKVYHLNESVKMQDSQPRDVVQKIGKGLVIGIVILLVAAVGGCTDQLFRGTREGAGGESVGRGI